MNLAAPVQVASVQTLARRLAQLPADLFQLLVVDEAHFAQNLDSKRSQALLRLARHPRIRAVWLLSGTPIKNGRPIQLLPLLMAIGHPLARDRRAYEELFCNGHWREAGSRMVWDCQGASRLEELQRLLRPQLLFRRKAHCLDLPPKLRCFRPVVLAASQQKRLDQMLQQRVENYRQRVAAGLVRSDAESLALLTAMRRLTALQKLPAALSLVQQLRASGEAVVLFSSFVAPLVQLERLLGGELLTGQVPLPQRQQRLSRFQA